MLKIRLSRGGTKKRPFYQIVVADSRNPRDGKFIEKLGYFNPLLPKSKPERLSLESERITHWIKMGAQPTLRVAKFLGAANLAPVPEKRNNPIKALPKKKAQERLKAAQAPKEAPAAALFTLYPEFFPGILDIGLYKRARENKIWSLDVINIRDSALDKHGSVDDTPFGGGSGMVMRADVIDSCLDKNIKNSKNELIYLSPRGELLTQKIAKQLSQKNGVDLICGHFEGIDQRVIEERKIREISIGDFILSGGETAAFVFLDSILRLLPGVLGNSSSLNEESFENNLLEYPQYTKPQEWKGRTVPEVLLSGNHAKIKDWRLAQSEDITRRQRQDLWEKYHK